MVTPDQRLLQLVHDAWSHSNGEWPTFGRIDALLDQENVDAVEVLDRLTPALVRREQSSVPPAPGERLRLTVRALAELPEPPFVADAFLSCLRYITMSEQAFVPDDDHPVLEVSSHDIARYFENSASVPRPPEVAQQLALQAGDFLHGESHLWTSYSGGGSAGRWSLTVSRAVRHFRGVATLSEYLTRTERLLGASDPQASSTGHTEPVHEEAAVAPDVDPRAVFVVHGRDLAAKKAVCDLIRDVDLRSVEWEELVAATGSASPYVGDAVTLAFKMVQAVVVLLTPDDEARLHPDLHGEQEPEHERNLTGQARPNVLFEAGMALAMHPDRTVLVEIGATRPFSDVAGRHAVRMTGAPSSLLAFVNRLKTAGCPVNIANPEWLNTERFSSLAARVRAPDVPRQAPAASTPPRGTVLPSGSWPARPRLAAKLHERGKSEYLVELINRGDVVLRDVQLILPDGVDNWHLMTDVLPAYPIPELEPRAYVRFPALVTMGGPVVIEADLRASLPDGAGHSDRATLSVYG